MGSEMPEIKAVAVLDGDGARVLAKFFSRGDFPSAAAETDMERRLHKKIRAASGGKGEAEVLAVEGFTVVYKSVGDVHVCVVGGPDENELILVAVLDTFVEALGLLLRHGVDKRNMLINYELALLCLDELIHAGVILELDAAAVEARVMLRGAVPESVSSYKEMTVSSLVEKVKDKAAKQFAK